jgi:hypothetical protein
MIKSIRQANTEIAAMQTTKNVHTRVWIALIATRFRPERVNERRHRSARDECCRPEARSF